MSLEKQHSDAGLLENLNPIFASHFQMEAIIQELEDRIKNKYKFQPISKAGDETEELLSPDSALGRLTVERVKDPNDQKVNNIYEFVKNFYPEESDPLRVIKGVIAKPKYGYHIIEQEQENEKKRIVAHVQNSYLKLLNQPKDATIPESILFSGYIFVVDDMRRNGLGTEITRVSFRWALERARMQLHNLKAFIVEARAESEPFANDVFGLKRCYYQDDAGNFREVPYIQPPVQWDIATGIPIDPKTGKIGDKDIRHYAAPEHFMVKMFNGKNVLSVAELLNIIATIHEDNYKLERYEGEVAPSDEVIQRTREKIKVFCDDLEKKLRSAKDEMIYLFSGKERAKKISELNSRGKNLIEHIAWYENMKEK